MKKTAEGYRNIKERRMLISEIVPRTGPTSKAPALSKGYSGGVPQSELGINDIEKLRENGEAQSQS